MKLRGLTIKPPSSQPAKCYSICVADYFAFHRVFHASHMAYPSYELAASTQKAHVDNPVKRASRSVVLTKRLYSNMTTLTPCVSYRHSRQKFDSAKYSRPDKLRQSQRNKRPDRDLPHITSHCHWCRHTSLWNEVTTNSWFRRAKRIKSLIKC